MKNLHESIIQIVSVGGTDISGNAKPQATSITGGPHWLQHEITEDAKDEALETSVKGALEAIAQGKTFDEWAKTTKMSPEVKAEVRKRLDDEDEGEDEGEDEESHGAHHQKDHITKAVFDSLPPEEQEKHQDSLRNAMNSHGLGDDEEEEQPQEEPEEQPQEEPAPEKAPGDGLDYEIEDEKEKEEPKMKLSKKKEKVTINPKMEQKEYTKKLISELKEKRKNRIDEKAPPGREDQVKSLKKKVGKDGAYAIAWAQHNKHGRPDNNEEVEIEENLAYLKNKDGHTFVISKREKKGDKFSMHVADNSGKKIKDWGSHPSLSGAKKFASNRGFNEEKVDEMSGDKAYQAADKAERLSRGGAGMKEKDRTKRKKQSQKFIDYSIKKTLNKEEAETPSGYSKKDAEWFRKEIRKQKKNQKEKVNEKYEEMTNTSQSSMTPLEILKALKDKVDTKDPAQMEGQSWSDFDQERVDQMTRTANDRSVLMYRIRDLDTGDAGEIENFTYVMKEKIPKYEQMGYKVVAQ